MPFYDHPAVVVQFASCLFMTGVICVIQLAHYPGFAAIERSAFMGFHARHSQALGIIAGPAMVMELASALWLARGGHIGFMINAGTVLILWGITFLVSVPAHNRLARGFDPLAWRRLVSTNWWRTLLWLGRSLVWLAWLGFSNGFQ